ncbi:MAG: PAC2 family protein [Candidatus Bathyarchaeia archaeon]
MPDVLRLKESFEFSQGLLIVGLAGWADAGNASTLSARHLQEKLGAVEIGEIMSGPFYFYSGERPTVTVERGVVKAYESFQNRLYWSRACGDQPDLLILIGHEPHLNWPGYVGAVLDAAAKTARKRVYTLGGFIGSVPHTAEPPITASTNNPALVAELTAAGIALTDYTGPTSVYSEFLWQGKERGLDVMSLWSPVPTYIHGPNPRAALSILRKLMALTGLRVDITEMEERARLLDVKIAEQAKMNPELRSLIEGLEMNYRLTRSKPSYTV